MMTEIIADLEIRIHARRDDGYPVEMTLNHEQEFDGGVLAPDLPQAWVASNQPQADGQRLFTWLCASDRFAAAWAEARGRFAQRRVRLRLDAGAPELHALPWELLCEQVDEGPIQAIAASSATPFSRYLAGRWQPGNPVLQRPIKVLVAIANPQDLAGKGLAPIDEEAEWASLQAATEGLDVELVRLPSPCTIAAIADALREGVHVLHLLGHGVFNPDRGEAALLLADEQNDSVYVYDRDLAAMLVRQLSSEEVSRDDKLRLVVLAACETAKRSSADAFRGMAPHLVGAGVPAVLAMQEKVEMETARAFTATFYRQLLQHGQVDLAGNEARATLLTRNLPGAAVPVLFMRLRNGALLGRRGRISSEREDMFWPFLLENIDRGLCIPFLGPRVNRDLLPEQGELAQRLADKYGYPLPDRENLVRVAQFMAVNDPGLLRQEYLRLIQRSLFSFLDHKPTQDEKRHFRNTGFSETSAALNWAERVLSVQENEIHHLLADLELPLYMTTNFDNFMALALQAQQGSVSVRQVGPRWQQAEAGTPQYVLAPRPSRADPVVFHLNGHDGDSAQRDHLVLSEDDYLAHVVRLSRDQETLLPMNVIEMLSRHSFLFLGYSIDDWEFRVILQGLLAPIAQTGGSGKVHVGVQLDVAENPGQEKVVDYLRRYLGRFNIEIYWGTPQQFVTDLHTRWQAYLEMDDEDW